MLATLTTGLNLMRQLTEGVATLFFTATRYTPKYLDQFLMVLLATFTTGLIFARQLKRGEETLCFDQNYTLKPLVSIISQKEPCCEGCR